MWTDDRTPLDELVAWLGLHIETFHPDDYPKGTYGFMDPDEDENLIWLQRDLQGTFRRFTLAHELGHAVLHCQGNRRLQNLSGHLYPLIAKQDTQQSFPEPSRKDPCHENDVQADMKGLCEQEPFQDTLGIGETYDPRSQRELAANIFAAELLIPRERVRALYLTEHISPNTLANIFAVSNAAMLNRLATLLKDPPVVALPIQDNHSPHSTKKAYDRVSTGRYYSTNTCTHCGRTRQWQNQYAYWSYRIYYSHTWYSSTTYFSTYLLA